MQKNAVLLKQCPEVLDELRDIPSVQELSRMALSSAELKPKWEALTTCAYHAVVQYVYGSCGLLYRYEIFT